MRGIPLTSPANLTVFHRPMMMFDLFRLRCSMIPARGRMPGLMAGLAAGLVLAGGNVRAENRPPNVLLILSDDQAWTDYGFMGHESIETPRLDRLAEESLTYTRGYVPSSLCRASLATIVTGLYPYQHGATSNDPARNPGRKPDADAEHLAAWYESRRMIRLVPTVPRRLHEQLGYATHQSGKWWEGHFAQGGFTHGMAHGDRVRGGRHGDEGLRIGREGFEPVTDFLDEIGNRPFLLWYAPFLPHTPHTPPRCLLEKYLERTDSEPVARYWAMCEWFDETCGQLLDILEERELADNTLVIYVCDNGWIQDPRRRNRRAPGAKRWPTEMGIRTPIMIRWPGRVEPRFDRTPVSSVDIAPTVLEACGLEAGDLPGVNLLDAGAVRERAAVFGDVHDHDFNPRPLDPAETVNFRWAISDGWKLIVPELENLDPTGEFEDPRKMGVQLYHLEEDPHEERNLAEQEPERVRRMRGMIDEWWTPDR